MFIIYSDQSEELHNFKLYDTYDILYTPSYTHIYIICILCQQYVLLLGLLIYGDIESAVSTTFSFSGARFNRSCFPVWRLWVSSFVLLSRIRARFNLILSVNPHFSDFTKFLFVLIKKITVNGGGAWSSTDTAFTYWGQVLSINVVFIDFSGFDNIFIAMTRKLLVIGTYNV